MEIKSFFDNFETMAEAPNGVQKLREMILQLAVQGKLVPQDPNDEPASVLLDKIRAEKKRLIKVGKIKKNEQLPVIHENELPYRLPDSWVWARFADLVYFEIGRTPPRKESINWAENGYPWVSISDLEHKQVISSTKESISEVAYNKIFKGKIVPAGTLLMSFKLTIGKISVLGVDAFHNEAIISIFPFEAYLKEYFFRCLDGYDLLSNQSNAIKGHTLNKEKINAIFIALPPLNEQKRIVAKVDELMALCDDLEARKQKTRQTCIQLNDACIDKMLAAREPARFNKHWQRIHTNFDLLYSQPGNVNKLRQTILQLAVQGKLVPQDPNDEPASVLLEKIQIFSERRMKERKRNTAKPLKLIGPDEMPFVLPQGWVWVRLGDIISVSSGVGLTKTKMLEGGIPVYGGNGITGYHNTHNVDRKTIVIGRVGFYCGSVHLTPAKAWVTDNAFITNYSEANIDQQFLVWLLRATDLKQNDSATAQPVISGRKIYPLVVALPPFNEQQRIVAKVDQLMALCDDLETKLKKSQKRNDRLMEAAVAEMLAA